MFSFAYPQYLWGLLAMAVPVLLHLLNRRRPAELRFPTLRFLRRAQLPQEGRRRLRDLLLLALRMLAIAGVVCVMARPRWTPRPAEAVPSSRRAAFVMDLSASMRGWGHLEQARAQVVKYGEELSGWEKQVFFSSGGQVERVSLEQADGLEPGYLAAEPAEALQAALDYLAGAGEQRLCLVSDFRPADWATAAHLVPSSIPISFLDCGKDGERNAAVTQVRSSPLPGGRYRVLVTVQNFSAVPEERRLTVRIGGESRTEELKLPGFSQLRTGFVLQAGEQDTEGVAELDLDDFPLDDTMAFSLRTSGLPEALVLYEESETGSIAATFAGRAVESHGEDGFQVRAVPSSLFSAEELGDCRVIFLLGGGKDLASSAFQAIAERVQEGGILFVTPGNGNAAVVLKRLRESGMLHAQAAGLVEAGHRGSLGVGTVEPESSLAALFGDWTDSDLYLFPIYRHVRLVPARGTRPLLTSLEKLPLLLESTYGKGKCEFFAFDFGVDWSGFPLSSAFVPLLRELSRDSVPEDYGIRRVQTGEKVALQDGTLLDTSRPGVAMAGTWPVEIHLPISESATERVHLEDLRASLSRDTGSASLPSREATVREFWHWAAVVLALILLMEGYLRCMARD